MNLLKRSANMRARRGESNRVLTVESLAKRYLMAADIAVSSGILTVTGTDDRDIIEINSGFNSSSGSARIRNALGTTLKFQYFSNVNRIDVYAEDGHDHVQNNTGIPSRLYGGEGNDTLLGGTHNDSIYGGNGNDMMEGHEGNDYMSAWYGNDTVRGQGGNDSIYGAWGDDWLYGGEGNDFIAGWSGKDWVFGEGENDTLKGGSGEDRLYGGAGDDDLRGESGNDYLYGEGDNDILRGDSGADYLSGSSGNAILYGGSEDDTLNGGSGHDSLYGDSGNDDLNGGSGNDGLFGGTGSDDLNGGSGDDRFLVMLDQAYNTRNETLEDIGWNDALIKFQDGDEVYSELANGDWYWVDNGSFTASEVIKVDAVLRELHHMTGNTRFLKRANGGELVFERMGERKGTFQVAGLNGQGRIALMDASFDSGDDWLAQVVIHEIAHNFDNENPNWNQWTGISGWTQTVGASKDEYVLSGSEQWYYKDSAEFARNYGRFDPMEDFATYFTKVVMEDTPWTFENFGNGGTDELKESFMEDFIDDMKS